MFVDTIDNVELFNNDLDEAKRKVICLYVHDIPPLRRRALLAKIEHLLLQYRNFIPGNLEYTLTMYYEQTVDDLSKIKTPDGPYQSFDFLLLAYNDIEDVYRCCGKQEDPDRERWQRKRESRVEYVLSRCRDFPIFLSSKFVANNLEIGQDHALIDLTKSDTTQGGVQTQAANRLEEERTKANIKRVQSLIDRIWDEDLPTLHTVHHQVLERANRIQEIIGQLV